MFIVDGANKLNPYLIGSEKFHLLCWNGPSMWLEFTFTVIPTKVGLFGRFCTTVFKGS